MRQSFQLILFFYCLREFHNWLQCSLCSVGWLNSRELTLAFKLCKKTSSQNHFAALRIKWKRATLGQSHGTAIQPSTLFPKTAQEKKEMEYGENFPSGHFPKASRLEIPSCARNASKALGLTCPPWNLFSEIIFCFWLPLHPVHSLQSTCGLPACSSSPPQPWLFQAEHLQQLELCSSQGRLPGVWKTWLFPAQV